MKVSNSEAIRVLDLKMFNIFKTAEVTSLSADDAYERLRKSEISLFDVREQHEWNEMRIPGALHAPLSSLADSLSRLPADKPVVFYCLSGMRSARALALSRSLGAIPGSHIAGGITAWKKAGLPIEH